MKKFETHIFKNLTGPPHMLVDNVDDPGFSGEIKYAGTYSTFHEKSRKSENMR